VAEEGISFGVLSKGGPVDDMTLPRELFDNFKARLAERKGDGTRLNAHEPDPKFGLGRLVYVAPTDEQAIAEARPAWYHHRENFISLWVKHNSPTLNETGDFDKVFPHMLIGSPETVARGLISRLGESGANYLGGNFLWGSMTTEQMVRSIRLFSDEVIPAVEAALGRTAAT
jgi:alkanesulfonate monooxygenase SsuD/methylene tetrahydromethanopterin reductase-like flavin-dependent oxidoreductase (luciferase family)